MKKPFISARPVLMGVLICVLGLTQGLHAQIAGVDIMGSPIPGITAIGHHAIGVNPALLATEKPFTEKDTFRSIPDSLSRKGKRDFRRSQRMRFFSGFEGGVVVNTPLLDGTPLLNWAGQEGKWTLESRRATAEQLHQSPTEIEARMRWVGWSRHGKRGGWGWTIEDRYSASLNPSADLASYAMLGQASRLFDQVELDDGTIVPVADLTNEQFERVETGLRDNGALLALELLDGSRIAVQHVRSYGAGFGVKLLNSGPLVLAAGLSGRYYRGSGYYEVDGENQTAFAAFNRGFGASLVDPNSSLGDALRPAGFGVALDAAVRVELANVWFASLAITELGSMDWKGESYSLNDPVATAEGWVNQEGGVLDALSNGLVPSSLFLQATPERRVVAMPSRLRLNGGMMVGKRTLIGIELAAPLNQVALRQPSEIGVGARGKLGPFLAMGGLRWKNGGQWRYPLALIWARKDSRSQFGLATDDLSGGLSPEKKWGLGWSYTRTLRSARSLNGGR
jgi:hypothetical protein